MISNLNFLIDSQFTLYIRNHVYLGMIHNRFLPLHEYYPNDMYLKDTGWQVSLHQNILIWEYKQILVIKGIHHI